MPLTAYERETVINFNDAEDHAFVTTYQRTVISRLRKNPGAELVAEMDANGTPGAMFKVPANLISIRKPRQISAETKAKLAVNASKARAKGRV